MKKTVCDLCGHDVTPLGMTDGYKLLYDHWHDFSVSIELSVKSVGSTTKDTRPLDLCNVCLRGLAENLGNLVQVEEETDAIQEVGSNSKAQG